MLSSERVSVNGSASGSRPLVGLCGRGLFVSMFGAAVLLVVMAVFAVLWSVPSDAGEPAEPLWSADVTVSEYSSVSVGAATADLFSNVGGSGDLQVRWLWSHLPGRDLRLAFEADVVDAGDYTLVVGDLSLEFPADSSGASSFKWTGVDVDWTDGQVVHARIVLTADVGALPAVTATTAVPDSSVPAAEVDSGEPEPEFLVANLGVGVDGSAGIQRTLGAARSGFAQAFTTGADTGGYVLGAVGVQVSLFVDASSVAGQLAVTVNSAAADGGPADTLCTLANPSALTTPGVISFEAPAGEDACARLAAGTTYFVVIEWVTPSGTDAFALIPQTYSTEDSAATDEDPGGAHGWSIADNSHYLTTSSEVRTWTAYQETASFKIKVTGTVSEHDTEPENTAPTGLPAITGTPQAGETLTVDTSAIDDEDGLDNVSYEYQWTASGADIDEATAATYTPTAGDVGKTIAVRVTFTDDADNTETLTSETTRAVAAVPLTVTVTADPPTTHDGSTEITFNLDFSEQFPLSYRTLKFHAFNVTGGEIKRAQRTNKPTNISWRITVEPDTTADITIQLPATTNCNTTGAICTPDGKKLSNTLSLTIKGPNPPTRCSPPQTPWACPAGGQLRPSTP